MPNTSFAIARYSPCRIAYPLKTMPTMPSATASLPLRRSPRRSWTTPKATAATLMPSPIQAEITRSASERPPLAAFGQQRDREQDRAAGHGHVRDVEDGPLVAIRGEADEID